MILPQTSRSVSIVLLALLLADCVHQYHHQSFIAPVATAQQLSLHSGWSFSADLTFPSSSNALNSYTDVALFSFFTPILSSSSFNNGSKGFSLGFLSLYDAPGGHPSEISLSVCLGVPGDDVGGGRPFLIPVWSSSQPSGQKVIVTRLQVHENGRLSLLGEDGKEVWAVADAASMEMRNDGNLIVRDSGNRSVWESFNNPRDCLLPGQKVSVGMEMASSNGMYKVVMQDGGLLFYQVSEYEWPLTYLIYTANATVDSYFANMGTAFTLDRNAPINLTASVASPNCSAAEKFNRSQAIVVLDLSSAAILLKDACGNVNSLPTNRTTDVVRLDVDGFIRDYTVRQLPNTSYELFSETSQQRPCFTPNACGSYGICSVSNTVGNAVRRLCSTLGSWPLVKSHWFAVDVWFKTLALVVMAIHVAVVPRLGVEFILLYDWEERSWQGSNIGIRSSSFLNNKFK